MKQSNSIIQSLDRGLEILEIVAGAKRPVSLNEMTSILKIDRSSVFRLANTLLQRGLLMYADGTKEFVLGSGLWRLSNQYPWIEFLTKLASEPIRKLARETAETAHLAIREGLKTIIVDNEMSTQPVGVRVQIGDENLLHCTSVGKALLFDYQLSELELLFGSNQLRSLTPNTLTDLKDLAENLDAARAEGYTVDDEEYFAGIRCVAAPVRDPKGLIVAAVGISAPSERLPAGLFGQMGSMVIETAGIIARKIRIQASDQTNHQNHLPVLTQNQPK